MKYTFLLLLGFFCLHVNAADDPSKLIRILNQKFSRVNDYKAAVTMNFDIPGVKMNTMKGKVFFKKPDKFKIRTRGIFFLPKQNPLQTMSAMLRDTVSYTTVISGYEQIRGRNCAIVNLIPLKGMNELILGKFWIDVLDPVVLKTQITTRNTGTIETEMRYGKHERECLPDQMIIRVETRKIKMSKMLSADLNKKSKPSSGQPEKMETGIITLNFSDYQVNTGFADSELQRDTDN